MPWLKRPDPRHIQIAILCSLITWGVLGLDLEVRPHNALVIVATAQLTQALGSRFAGIPFDPKSALISSLSLTLLLRAANPAIAAAAAVLTIGSKFAIRANGKHVFNPTNFGIAVSLLLFDGAWVSPGQWGSAALLGFAIAGLGQLVVYRAARSDVTWAFLVFWVALVFGRALYLGDPPKIPLHNVKSGAFLIFAFLMISDPKTTPDTRAGRILFAAIVAAVAGVIRFRYFEPNALIWALFGCAPLVPLIDRWLPGAHYAWTAPTVGSLTPSLGGAK